MPLTCSFFLFVLKLENRLSYELAKFYREHGQKKKKANTYFFSVGTSASPRHLPIFFLQIWILNHNSLIRELKIRVVGLVLKHLFTYFEMLIVLHML